MITGQGRCCSIACQAHARRIFHDSLYTCAASESGHPHATPLRLASNCKPTPLLTVPRHIPDPSAHHSLTRQHWIRARASTQCPTYQAHARWHVRVGTCKPSLVRDLFMQAGRPHGTHCARPFASHPSLLTIPLHASSHVSIVLSPEPQQAQPSGSHMPFRRMTPQPTPEVHPEHAPSCRMSLLGPPLRQHRCGRCSLSHSKISEGTNLEDHSTLTWLENQQRERS